MKKDRYPQVTELKSELQPVKGAGRIRFCDNRLNIVSRRESFFYKFVHFISAIKVQSFENSPELQNKNNSVS